MSLITYILLAINVQLCIMIPLYTKYYQKILITGNVYAAYGITGMLECEKICAKHGNYCEGANVYRIEDGHYACELLRQVPDIITPDDMNVTQHSKFIKKTGKCIYYLYQLEQTSFISR